MTVIMVNTCPNPSMKGGAPCTVKMIRLRKVSVSLMTFSNYRSEAIRSLVELGAEGEGQIAIPFGRPGAGDLALHRWLSLAFWQPRMGNAPH